MSAIVMADSHAVDARFKFFFGATQLKIFSGQWAIDQLGFPYLGESP